MEQVSITIPCGHSFQTASVLKEKIAGMIRSNEPLNGLSEEEIIRQALANPIDSEPLSSLAKGAKRVLLISPDHTRPMPSRITIPLLLEEIRKGNSKAEIVLLVATGLHRKTTDEELKKRYGEKVVHQERIIVHDANNESQLVYYGDLPSGGELWLNRLVSESDLVISEGFIEPHFFAGYSGGRKSILPGVAGSKSIRYNHNAGFIHSPFARQGILDTNPVHRDMAEAARKAKLRFILNVLLDSNKRIVAAVAGDSDTAHRRGCEICRESAAKVPVPAEIVITSNGGYPLDQNLYQCVKGLTSAEACVLPGGWMILCAGLYDGHGGERFIQWFMENDSPASVLKQIQSIAPELTQPDQWQAQILARILLKAHCVIVTGPENQKLVEKVGMIWQPDLANAINYVTERLPVTARITVIPDGVGVYFPSK